MQWNRATCTMRHERMPPPPHPHRCRPGDPFYEQQQEEQRELAAMAAEAEPVAAPRPAALAVSSATFGPAGAAAGGAIPGIGDAVAMPTLPQATAVVDVFSIHQQPYDARGGRAPAAGAGPAAPGQRLPDEEHRRQGWCGWLERVWLLACIRFAVVMCSHAAGQHAHRTLPCQTVRCMRVLTSLHFAAMSLDPQAAGAQPLTRRPQAAAQQVTARGQEGST